ncbi:MAG TPA: cytochrome b N-terminal domain-containing protein [Thermoguttaceae bacterium]|nr:cytochrome b N-terminal domain-containing protein [Thermoguttaceae bacterium]
MPEQTIEMAHDERESSAGVTRRFAENVWNLPRTFRESAIRHGRPTSDRAASQAIFTNFFLHILPARIHRYSLQLKATLGLGVISLVLFGLLTFTGVTLMIYYKPSTIGAYDSMKDIQYVVPTGRLMRNIHRWSAHAMVACVVLHMARVFFTGAYSKPRELNWVVGIVLLVLTLALSFTGYLLPWDQLAFWAVTIGSAIAESPKEVTDAVGITSWFDIGGMTKHLLLGANHVGQEALIRFYLLHVIVLPLVTTVLIGLHFWRIRKDGGLTRPRSEDALPDDTATAPEAAPSKTYGLMAVVPGKTPAVDRALANTIPTWPNALYAIGALSMLTLAAMLLLGYFFDAPLAELANPAVPENPAKAPWYFLGLQEMVSYSAFMGGIGIPTLIVIGLCLVPYVDRERAGIGGWFGTGGGKSVCLLSGLFTLIVTVGLLAFTVNYGWLRNAYPDIQQWIITLVNPGTVLLVVLTLWSAAVTWTTNSTRLGALALFSCLLVGFVILTYFATVHRGPNWDFYWWPSQWPTH